LRTRCWTACTRTIPHPGETDASWDEEIRRRVEVIRNGAAIPSELKEVLAEMERGEAELSDDPPDESEDRDPAEVKAAWAEEIGPRVEEIRNGTAKDPRGGGCDHHNTAAVRMNRVRYHRLAVRELHAARGGATANVPVRHRAFLVTSPPSCSVFPTAAST